MGARMLTLYYWPGASSVIPHITLEEIGAPYERELINLAKGEHKSNAYLQILVAKCRHFPLTAMYSRRTLPS